MNITFWVTEKCNLACKYCYVHKQPKGNLKPYMVMDL